MSQPYRPPRPVTGIAFTYRQYRQRVANVLIIIYVYIKEQRNGKISIRKLQNWVLRQQRTFDVNTLNSNPLT
jgi:hypothetical protein